METEAELPQWTRADSLVQIRTPHLYLELDEAAGGAIVRAEDPKTGESLLGGLGNDLIRYRVSGGLWRMGYEFGGGTWREAGRTSGQPVRLEVRERGADLEIAWTNAFDGEQIERRMSVSGDSPRIHFRVVGRAGRRRTVTAQFDSGLNARQLTMDVPGGVVTRDLEKVYSPTFWPFQHFVHLQDAESGRGMAIIHRRPGAVSLNADGRLQVVALRNATIERAYGVLPLFGNPAKGYEKERHTFEYALEFTGVGKWSDNGLAASVYAPSRGPWVDSRAGQLARLTRAQIALDRDDVFMLADKPAERGDGRIVRLYTLVAVGQPIGLRLKSQRIRRAALCDARERDLQALPIDDGQLKFQMPGTLASLRLITSD
jgi:alpha-mannosidase